MSKFDFKGAVEKAAQSIKRSTYCPEHGKTPEFTIRKTSQGANVEWNFCCDTLKKIVEDKFVSETNRYMGDAVTKAIFR